MAKFTIPSPLAALRKQLGNLDRPGAAGNVATGLAIGGGTALTAGGLAGAKRESEHKAELATARQSLPSPKDLMDRTGATGAWNTTKNIVRANPWAAAAGAGALGLGAGMILQRILKKNRKRPELQPAWA